MGEVEFEARVADGAGMYARVLRHDERIIWNLHARAEAPRDWRGDEQTLRRRGIVIGAQSEDVIEQAEVEADVRLLVALPANTRIGETELRRTGDDVAAEHVVLILDDRRAEL